MPEATNRDHQWHLFNQVKRAYPKQVNMAQAWVEWQRIRPLPDQALVDRMLKTLAWQKKDRAWLADGGNWIPWLRSWLRDKRWTDEPFEPSSAMPVRQERPRTKSEAISRQNEEAVRTVIERLRSGHKPTL